MNYLKGRDYNCRELANVFGGIVSTGALLFFVPGIAATAAGDRMHGETVSKSVVRNSATMWPLGVSLAAFGAYAGFFIGVSSAEKLQDRRYGIVFDRNPDEERD